jgi:hypothetical protein
MGSGGRNFENRKLDAIENNHIKGDRQRKAADNSRQSKAADKRQR